MQANHLCLLGFSKSSEEIIKSILKDLPIIISPITWVSANDKNLTGVIINASFLDTPQIQKYVKFVNVPVVSAYNNDSGKDAAEEFSSIPSLDLRTATPKTIKSWINSLLTKGDNLSPAIAAKDNLSATSKDSSNSTNEKASQWSNNYSDLIEQILMKEPVVIEAIYKDNHTWIRPNKELVFVDYPRDSVPGIENWRWRVRDNLTIPEAARQLKVDLWLFESLWQAEISLEDTITSNTYYQMDRWPQPLGKKGRSQALRLAAFAQSKPVNIDILLEKSGYDLSLIRKFIYATKVSGQMKKVVVDDNRLNSDTTNLTSSDSQEIIQKRGLLNRFRQKLGL